MLNFEDEEEDEELHTKIEDKKQSKENHTREWQSKTRVPNNQFKFKTVAFNNNDFNNAHKNTTNALSSSYEQVLRTKTENHWIVDELESY